MIKNTLINSIFFLNAFFNIAPDSVKYSFEFFNNVFWKPLKTVTETLTYKKFTDKEPQTEPNCSSY